SPPGAPGGDGGSVVSGLRTPVGRSRDRAARKMRTLRQGILTKRGLVQEAPQAPPNGGGEAPAGRPKFFTGRPSAWRLPEALRRAAQGHQGTAMLVLGLLLIVAIALSAGSGAFAIEPRDLLRVLLFPQPEDALAHQLLVEVRLPRIVLGVILG